MVGHTRRPRRERNAWAYIFTLGLHVEARGNTWVTFVVEPITSLEQNEDNPAKTQGKGAIT
jgi:hypothetical protein